MNVLPNPAKMRAEEMWSEIRTLLSELGHLPPGSPGSIVRRDTTSGAYLYRQYYDQTGRKRDEYVGRCYGDDAAERRSAALRQIGLHRRLLAIVKQLRRLGLSECDSHIVANLSKLSIGGFFRPGRALLVGSAALAANLNLLGSPGDVDCALRSDSAVISSRFADTLVQGISPISQRWHEFLQEGSHNLPIFSKDGIAVARAPSIERLLAFHSWESVRTYGDEDAALVKIRRRLRTIAPERADPADELAKWVAGLPLKL